MRISVNSDDPGYVNWRADMRGIRVFLDGNEMSKVETFDTDLGIIVRFKTDEKGRVYVDPPGSDHIAREELRGIVTYKLPDNG